MVSNTSFDVSVHGLTPDVSHGEYELLQNLTGIMGWPAWLKRNWSMWPLKSISAVMCQIWHKLTEVHCMVLCAGITMQYSLTTWTSLDPWHMCQKVLRVHCMKCTLSTLYCQTTCLKDTSIYPNNSTFDTLEHLCKTSVYAKNWPRYIFLGLT